MPAKKIQLGKQGITDNFIQSLKNYFKNCKSIRVSVLKSCCRDREQLKKINEELLEKLGKNFDSRIIGYVIVLKKFGREILRKRKN